MEEEAARITKETEELEKKKKSITDSKQQDGAGNGAAAAAKDTATRDGYVFVSAVCESAAFMCRVALPYYRSLFAVQGHMIIY